MGTQVVSYLKRGQIDGAVKTRRWILFLLLAPMVLLAGCGGGSTFNVQNPPPPVQESPSIAFQGTPPQSILINTTASLTATVSNDPSNAGVNWVLTCANPGNCGTLSALHTASGAAVTYTPSLSLIGNSQSVTIVAYAAADQASNVSASINVGAFGNVLNGIYVFHAEGSDSTLNPYQIAGLLTLDGSGDVCSGFITSGQQTLNTVFNGSVSSNIAPPSGTPCVTSSYYFIGSDGRGFLSVSLPDPAISPAGSGPAITETFSLVVLSSAKALISEISSTSSAGTFSGSGTLELQDPTAAATLPAGGYAFATSGTDTTPNPIAYAGIVNINSGSFAGANSLADETALAFGGSGPGYVIVQCSPPNGPTGTVSWASPNSPSSVVTMNLGTNQIGTTCFSSALTFTGYIVDADHIRLIETDAGFFTAGIAVGQTGPFNGASFTGPYVFEAPGIAPITVDVFGLPLSTSFTSTGVVCPDGAGGLDACTDSGGNPSGGYVDMLFLDDSVALPGGNNSPCPFGPCPGQISAEVSNTVTYSIDVHDIGRVTTSNFKLSPQPSPGNPLVPSVNFYLTGPPATAQTPGSPVLVLLTGGLDATYPGLGVGIAYPQASSVQTLSLGNGELYGVSFTQQTGTELDGTGQITAALNQSSPGGTLSGVVDDSSGGVATFNNSLADVFNCPQGASSCPDPFGRFSDSTFLGTGSTYYLIDSNTGFFIETDLVANFEAGLTPQVALGSFARRCDVTVMDPSNPNYCQPAPAGASAKHVGKVHRSR
jgi:hypothetical protein